MVPPERHAWVDALRRDWQRAELDARERAICVFAVKLTHAPARMEEADLAPLRAAGLDDRAIVDVVHIAGYFAYANRLADGLGCDPEASW